MLLASAIAGWCIAAVLLLQNRRLRRQRDRARLVARTIPDDARAAVARWRAHVAERRAAAASGMHESA